MNFLGLEYFLVVAQEKSIAKAAERLFVSQQSLSEQVKRLETELGIALIRRTRPHTLTQAGEVFLKRAREILDARERLYQDIAAIQKALPTESMSIGIFSFDAPPFLAELLTRFHQIHPEVTVNVVSCDVRIPPSKQDEIDLFFMLPPLPDSMQHIILREDYLAVAVSKALLERVYGARTDAVCRQLRETGDLAVLREVPFLDVYRPHAQVERLPDLQAYGIATVTGHKTDSGSFSMSMCLKGAGAMLSFEDAMLRVCKNHSAEATKDLLLFRLDQHREDYSLAISHKKGKQLSAIERVFVEQARLLLKNG